MYKHITKEGSEFYDLAMLLSENDSNVAFCDIESTGLDARKDKILTLQVMVKGNIFIYDFLNLNMEHLKYIINLLNLTKTTTVFHNAKFDIKFLYHHTGIWLEKVFDTMNCEVLINAGVGKSFYSLEELAKKYCGVELDKTVRESFFKTEVTSLSMQMLNYSADDVKLLEEIYHKQLEIIEQANETKVLQLEMDLIPVVAKMEYEGVLLNTEAWTELATKEKERLIDIELKVKDEIFTRLAMPENALKLADQLSIPVKTKRDRTALELISDASLIKDWAKRNFNLGSYVQLPKGLNLIGISVTSADKKELKKYQDEDVVKLLLERSESQKRISTYGMNIIEEIHPTSGRIHTEFLNMGAATGRFSSTNPNLQNIPTAQGYREAFTATPGFDWLSLDYSQQEYRLAGGVSKEERIIEAYVNGADMHTATASIVFNKKLDEVTKQERNRGKTINFAILYGSSEFGLKNNLGISIEEAKQIINSFNSGYPRLYAFKQAVEEAILKMGFSSTPLGRRRYNIAKPLYMNGGEYLNYISRVKREGFNHIIQGGGADIIKIAMVNIYRNNPFGDKFRLLIQVHDELNAEADKSISKDAVEFMREEMLKAEQPFLGEIPAKVDSKINTHWEH